MPAQTDILSGKKFSITLDRLCYQLIENHGDFSQAALVGLQPRGTYLARALHSRLTEILGRPVDLGILDPTFYRDDFRQHKGPLIPSTVEVNFEVEGKSIVLVDDVLYTGRTIRAGMDALLDFGRPARVELLVLVDRRYSRQLPIEPTYRGLTVDARASQKVRVNWQATEGENGVWLLSENNDQ